MLSEFKYCPNPDVDVPKMFIDMQIGGKDAEGNPGIDGNLFAKELFCLSDEMGKKNIQVWINSEGGFVQEGQSVYAAILHSKAKVDTVCYGLAASIAGVIFQAGRKRFMTDYSNLMYHPAYNEDGTEDKGLTAMNDSIAVMISSRTGNSLDRVKALMNAGKPKEEKGTWINAVDACKMGFCDEEMPSDEANLKRMQSLPTPQAKWQFANKILNQIKETPKIKSMKQVCNKLGLNEEANEASVVNAIEDMRAKNKASMEDLQAKLNKKNEEMETLNKEMTNLKNEIEENKKAKAKSDDEAKAQLVLDTAAKAKTEVTNLVATGRIKNEKATVDKWEASFVKNFTETKELSELLPVTKAGANFKNLASSTNYGSTLDAGTKAELEMNGIKFGSMEYENALRLKSINK